MAPEALRQALQAIASYDRPPQVHLTGGEPFLNYPLLLQAAQIGAELGLTCYLETNAGWCVRQELVHERFTALRQAGLQAVLISCSPFHAEHIPPQRTLLAIQVALQVFGAGRTIVYLSEWLDQIVSFGLETTTPLARYVEACGASRAGQLLWDGYGLISGGRSGYALGHLAQRQHAQIMRGETCQAELLYAHHSHFDLYGNFIPSFCGGLAVGCWGELPSLLQDFAAGRYPPLVEILLRGGPYGLYELACEEYGYTPLPEGYAGKCHLCVDVRKCLVEKGEFQELRPTGFYEMIQG